MRVFTERRNHFNRSTSLAQKWRSRTRRKIHGPLYLACESNKPVIYVYVMYLYAQARRISCSALQRSAIITRSAPIYGRDPGSVCRSIASSLMNLIDCNKIVPYKRMVHLLAPFTCSFRKLKGISNSYCLIERINNHQQFGTSFFFLGAYS